MTWEFLKVRNRRRLIGAGGAVGAAAALTAAALAANAGSAGAPDVPVLTTVPYTAVFADHGETGTGETRGRRPRPRLDPGL